MMGIWEAAGRPPVDGVISGDAVLMSHLLEALGPVDSPVAAPGWPTQITSDNVVEVMNRDTFMTTSQTLSDQWQTAIGTALWGALLSRPWPPQALATALGRAVEERHLQVYATDPAQQQALTDLGCERRGRVRHGAAPARGAPGLLRQPRRVLRHPAGQRPPRPSSRTARTEVTVTVTLHNAAPTGPPSILLGTPTFQATEGLFQAQLQVYLPPGATVVKSTVDGGPGIFDLVEEEFGRPMAIQFLDVPAGGTTAATFVYRLPPG